MLTGDRPVQVVALLAVAMLVVQLVVGSIEGPVPAAPDPAAPAPDADAIEADGPPADGVVGADGENATAEGPPGQLDPSVYEPRGILRPGRLPNLLFILTDDQNAGTMDFMPRTKERIFDQGVSFESAYLTTPVCCPARVSLLTGQYASVHGTRTNFDPMYVRENLVTALHTFGYYVGHVGKWLNSWDGGERREYDFWVSHEGAQSPYYDALLNVNGPWVATEGYITHHLRDQALLFLEQGPIRRQAWALFFWPNAPHAPAEPAPGDERLYENVTLPPSPALNEADVSDKPRWLRERAPLSDEVLTANQELRLKMLRALKPVDEAIDALLDALEARGQLDDTLVVYMSDNGVLYGEHRLTSKHYPYEETMHVPLALRLPGVGEPGMVVDELVTNLDIAATIYDVLRLPTPLPLHGRSLVPLLEGTATDWPEATYHEAWPDDSPPWQAAHTQRWVYIETKGDLAELYDLEADPHQLENVAQDPAYADRLEAMRALLESLRTQPLSEA